MKKVDDNTEQPSRNGLQKQFAISMMKKPKTFDCVAFKREAQSRLYEATRDMSPQQRREYLHQVIESGPLAGFWRKLEEADHQRQSTGPNNSTHPAR